MKVEKISELKSGVVKITAEWREGQLAGTGHGSIGELVIGEQVESHQTDTDDLTASFITLANLSAAPKRYGHGEPLARGTDLGRQNGHQRYSLGKMQCVRLTKRGDNIIYEFKEHTV